MAENLVQITITALTAELQSQLAVAEDRLRQLAARTEQLNTSMANGGSRGAKYALELKNAAKEIETLTLRIDELKVALQAVENADSFSTKIAQGMASASSSVRSYADRVVAGMSEAGQAAENNLRKVTEEAAKSEEGLRKTGHASTGVARELVVLGHEAATGNFSRFGGSLIVLAENMNGLSRILDFIKTPLGAFVALVTAATVAVGAFALKALHASQAIKELQGIGAIRFSDVTKTELEDLRKQIEYLPGGSQETANKVLRSFTTMSRGSVDLMKSMIGVLPMIEAGFNEKLPEAAQHLADAWGKLPQQGSEFLHKLMGDSAQARDVISRLDEAIQGGDMPEARKVFLDGLVVAAQRYEDVTGKVTEKHKAEAAVAQGLTAGLSSLVGAEINVAEEGKKIDETFKAIDGATAVKAANDMKAAFSKIETGTPEGAPLDAMRDQIAQEKAMSQGRQSDLIQIEMDGSRKRLAVGDLYGADRIKVDKELAVAETNFRKAKGEEALEDTRAQIAKEAAFNDGRQSDSARREVEIWQARLATGELNGHAEIKATEELSKAEKRLREQDSKESVKDTESVAKQMAEAWKGPSSALLAAKAKLFKDMSAVTHLEVDDRRKVEDEIASLSKQSRDARGSEEIAAARTRVSAVNLEEGKSGTQKLISEASVWKQLLDGDKLNAHQREEVAKDYNIALGKAKASGAADAIAAAQAEIQESKQGSMERVAHARVAEALITAIKGQGSKESVKALSVVANAEREYHEAVARDYVKSVNDQVAALKGSEQSKLQVVRNSLKEMELNQQQDTEAYRHLKSEEVRIAASASQEKIRLDKLIADNKLSAAKSTLGEQEAQSNLEGQIYLRTNNERARLLKQFQQQAYQIERQILQDEYDSNASNVIAHQQTGNQIEQLERQHMAKLRQIDRQALSENIAFFRQFTDAITSSFASGIQGMIFHTMTFKQAVTNLVQNLVGTFINVILRMASEWAAGQLGMAITSNAADTGMLAQKSVTAIAGLAIQGEADRMSIIGSAGAAYAGAYAATAAIPFVGPELAPAAAMEAYSATIAATSFIPFAIGATDLPKDMPGMLHQGEMIIPKSFAEGIRSGDMTLGGQGQSQTTSDTFHINISAVDARSVKQLFMDHGGALMDSLSKQRRNLHPAFGGV